MYIPRAKSKIAVIVYYKYPQKNITVDRKITKWTNLWPVFGDIESRRYRAGFFYLPSAQYCPDVFISLSYDIDC